MTECGICGLHSADGFDHDGCYDEATSTERIETMRIATRPRNIYTEAVAALVRAGFTYYEGNDYANKQVGPNVWLRAYIAAGDERIRLRWETRNGVEVADRISINIDDNAAAFVAALAAVEVNA